MGKWFETRVRPDPPDVEAIQFRGRGKWMTREGVPSIAAQAEALRERGMNTYLDKVFGTEPMPRSFDETTVYNKSAEATIPAQSDSIGPRGHPNAWPYYIGYRSYR